MEFEILGWAADEPTLDLDHRSFSYAGKFVMSSTGKAVVRDDGEIIAAVSFNEDRTDPEHTWLRYLTVRADRRGEGIGSKLALAVRERIIDRGYTQVSIAVNNPFAYEALYRAGFGYAGRTTGLAELVLCYPTDRTASLYRAGLEVYRERSDLDPAERDFLDANREGNPPAVHQLPSDWHQEG